MGQTLGTRGDDNPLANINVAECIIWLLLDLDNVVNLCILSVRYLLRTALTRLIECVWVFKTKCAIDKGKNQSESDSSIAEPSSSSSIEASSRSLSSSRLLLTPCALFSPSDMSATGFSFAESDAAATEPGGAPPNTDFCNSVAAIPLAVSVVGILNVPSNFEIVTDLLLA